MKSEEIMYSVLILTHNEEKNLPRCLELLSLIEDVVVLDSYSDDRTLEIARSRKVRVYQRTFDNYAAQRNFGINEIEYENKWLLLVDADERPTLELQREIKSALFDVPSGVSLFRLRRKDYFMGKWIKRSSGYPTWFGRLIKIGAVRVERSINEEYVTDGEIRFLKHHLDHYPFNKGIAHWVDKHNVYSTMEASLLSSSMEDQYRLSQLFNDDPAIRRKTVKALFYRLPGRSIIMFLALYIFRGGLLDGKAGLRFCMLRAFYELLITCKIEDLSIINSDKSASTK